MKLLQIPSPFKGVSTVRKEKCRICSSEKGLQVGEVDYWDIANARLIKCEKCGLTQLDPMLTDEETAKGCLAYYIEESLRVSPKEQKRNMLRNFRRGYLFAISLKGKGYHPKDVLELGPGSGYFTAGLKFVFPKVKITVMDINKETLDFNALHHQYETIEAHIENYSPALDNKFDLVIARDIIEHVVDISKVVSNVQKYSKENGLFHFITPNGHEDVWKHYLTFNHLKKASELLINHANYFDGQGLLNHLIAQGFCSINYYTYNLKTTRKGRGWKTSEKFMAAISQKKNSDFYVQKVNEVKEISFDKNSLLNQWYIYNRPNLITNFICWYLHNSIIRLSPTLNIGHEIHGLFKITKSDKA